MYSLYTERQKLYGRRLRPLRIIASEKIWNASHVWLENCKLRRTKSGLSKFIVIAFHRCFTLGSFEPYYPRATLVRNKPKCKGILRRVNAIFFPSFLARTSFTTVDEMLRWIYTRIFVNSKTNKSEKNIISVFCLNLIIIYTVFEIPSKIRFARLTLASTKHRLAKSKIDIDRWRNKKIETLFGNRESTMFRIIAK